MAATLPTSSQSQHFAGPNLKLIAGASSVAGQRRDHNEDAVYVSPDLDLFIVADGMGGHDNGELASQFAVEVLAQELSCIRSEPHSDDEIDRLVKSAISDAHCLIASLGDGSLYRGAATTVVLAQLFKNRLFVLGIGDSRAYLIRRHHIEQLTIDDSFPQMLADAGVINQDQVRTHPYRNQLMSALGLDDFKPKKRIRVVELEAGDRLLLASDGLTDVLDDAGLLKVLDAADTPQQVTETLIQHAVDHNAGDDITCVVFDVHGKAAPHSQPSFREQLRGLWKAWFGAGTP